MAGKDAIESPGTLDRSRLHVFLAGPGQGEAVAVALPQSGWIVVDGCKVAGALPVGDILGRWKDASEDVEWMVLTHPHEDHVGGFADLVEAASPLRIAVTAAAEPRDGLRAEAAWWREAFADGQTFEQFKLAAEVRNAFRAIDTWLESRPGGLLGVCDGARLQVTSPSVEVWVRAPTAEEINAFFQRPDFPKVVAERANDLSMVLELRYGETCVVLGADLPNVRNRNPVPSGWEAVLARHPDLGQHAYLKVPHHGSRDAIHPGLADAAPARDRTWCLTPYNSSRLPRADTDEGLRRLLASQREVRLTAMSTSASRQIEHDGAVTTPDTLNDMTRAARRNEPICGSDGMPRPYLRLQPLDPVWLCSFDDQGNLVDARAGRAALRVLRG